jgi:hypothetical protein
MAAVAVSISRPGRDSVLVGDAPVSLQGAIAGEGTPKLYFKWYSTLPPPGSGDGVLNGPRDNPLDFRCPLTVGSHILTLAAKDVAEDTAEALSKVVHVGMAGGRGQGPDEAWLVHVLRATIVIPQQGAVRQLGNTTLAAEAPATWTKADYQEINRIAYRWQLTPQAPAVGPSAELSGPRGGGDIPAQEPGRWFRWSVRPPGGEAVEQGATLLNFDVNILRYQGPLPAALTPGSYVLNLRVEDARNPSAFHAASVTVGVTS